MPIGTFGYVKQIPERFKRVLKWLICRKQSPRPSVDCPEVVCEDCMPVALERIKKGLRRKEAQWCKDHELPFKHYLDEGDDWRPE